MKLQLTKDAAVKLQLTKGATWLRQVLAQCLGALLLAYRNLVDKRVICELTSKSAVSSKGHTLQPRGGSQGGRQQLKVALHWLQIDEHAWRQSPMVPHAAGRLRCGNVVESRAQHPTVPSVP